MKRQLFTLDGKVLSGKIVQRSPTEFMFTFTSPSPGGYFIFEDS